MKKSRGGKMVAPIIISIFLVLYCLFFFFVVLTAAIPVIVKIIGGLICILLTGCVVFVVVERIKEIRSGEEDDLSKY